MLPDSWSEWTVAVSHPIGTRGGTGQCLEAHDLAASKLVAYREKDRVFVNTLLDEGLIDGQILLDRIRALPCTTAVRDRLIRWVEITTEERK
jgi:hypothetical protein